MRRKLPYLGLSLFLIGVVCLSVGVANSRNVTYASVHESLGEWELVSYLTSGKTYVLQIESGEEWGEPFKNGDFVDPQPVNVTVTSPEGGVTCLQAFFDAVPSTSPYYKVNPAIVNVTYQVVDSSSLDVDTPSSRIRVTAKKSGNYTARVLEQGLWAKDPPDYMTFYEEVISNKEVWALLVGGGGLFSVSGVVALIWGAFRKESARRRRMHR